MRVFFSTTPFTLELRKRIRRKRSSSANRLNTAHRLEALEERAMLDSQATLSMGPSNAALVGEVLHAVPDLNTGDVRRNTDGSIAWTRSKLQFQEVDGRLQMSESLWNQNFSSYPNTVKTWYLGTQPFDQSNSMPLNVDVEDMRGFALAPVTVYRETNPNWQFRDWLQHYVYIPVEEGQDRRVWQDNDKEYFVMPESYVVPADLTAPTYTDTFPNYSVANGKIAATIPRPVTDLGVYAALNKGYTSILSLGNENVPIAKRFVMDYDNWIYDTGLPYGATNEQVYNWATTVSQSALQSGFNQIGGSYDMLYLDWEAVVYRDYSPAYQKFANVFKAYHDAGNTAKLGIWNMAGIKANPFLTTRAEFLRDLKFTGSMSQWTALYGSSSTYTISPAAIVDQLDVFDVGSYLNYPTQSGYLYQAVSNYMLNKKFYPDTPSVWFFWDQQEAMQEWGTDTIDRLKTDGTPFTEQVKMVVFPSVMQTVGAWSYAFMDGGIMWNDHNSLGTNPDDYGWSGRIHTVDGQSMPDSYGPGAQVNYGQGFQNIDWYEAGKWAVSENKDILEASTPWEMVEIKPSGSTTWRTGDATLPSEAMFDEAPFGALKRSADGREALLLLYDGFNDGATKTTHTIRVAGVNFDIDVFGQYTSVVRLHDLPLATPTDCTVNAAGAGGNGANNGVDDHYRVALNSFQTHVDVFLNGTLSASTRLFGMGKLTITGSSDKDTLTIDNSNGFFVVPGGIVFSAGGAADQLTVTGGTATNEIYDAAAGTMSIQCGLSGTQITTFTGVESILSTTLANYLSVTGTTADDVMSYTQGDDSATGRVTISNAASMDFSNAAVLNICGGAGTDTIRLNNSSTPAGLSRVVVNGLTVNHAPVIDLIASPAAISVNSGQQTIAMTGIGDGDNATQALQVLAVSDNAALIPDPTVDYTSPTTSGSLVYAPATNKYGTAHITVTVRDAGLDAILGNADDATFTRAFTVVVSGPPVTGAVLWLDASNRNTVFNESGVLATAGQSVATWNNIAPGMTGAVTQSTAANQPIYGSHTLNGLPVLYFDGTNDSLTSASTYTNTGTSLSAFIVQRRTSDTASRRSLAFIGPTSNSDSSSTANWCLDTGAGGTRINVQRSTPWNQIAAPGVNTAYLTEVIFNGTNMVAYVNGTAVGSTRASTGNFDINTIAVAAGWTNGNAANWFAGDIAEVVIYNSALISTDRVAVENYLSTKWNIVNLVPTINTIANPPAVNMNAGLQTVNLSNITAGAGESQVIQITATSNNTALIPNPTVNYTSPNTTGSLTYTPVADKYGSATLTVTVRDAGPDGVMGNSDDKSTAKTFVVNVNGLPVSGAALWLDASNSSSVRNGSGTVATAGQGVGTWYNVAAGATGSVKATNSSTRPVYGSATMGGKPVISFDGSDDALYTTSTYANTGNRLTAFVVMRNTAITTNYARSVSFVGATSGNDYDNVGNWCLDSGSNGTSLYVERNGGHAQGSLPAVNVAYIAEVVFDGTNCTTYVNGTMLGTPFASTGNFNLSKVAVGAGWSAGAAQSWCLTGDIAEVVVFNSALSTADRQTMEAYLTSKWLGGGGAGLAAEAMAAGSDSDNLIIVGSSGVNDAITATSTGSQSGTVRYNTSGAANVTFSGIKTMTLVGQPSENDVYTIGGATLGTGQDCVTIDAAKLQLSAGHTLAPTADVVVTGQATLDLGGQTATVDGVTLQNGSIVNGQLSATAFAVQSGTIDAMLQGAGTLTKIGSGAVTLSGTNSYRGGTVVREGKLVIAGNDALPSQSSLTVLGAGSVSLASSLTKALRLTRLTLVYSGPSSSQSAAAAIQPTVAQTAPSASAAATPTSSLLPSPAATKLHDAAVSSLVYGPSAIGASAIWPIASLIDPQRDAKKRAAAVGATLAVVPSSFQQVLP